jgi:hypothetical protein
MILRQDRVAEGVEGVWQQGGATEATLRAILASGDSIARAAAMQEAAAIATMRTDSIRAAGGGIPAATPAPLPQAQAPPAQPRQPLPAPPAEQRDSVVRLGPPIGGVQRDTSPQLPRER